MSLSKAFPYLGPKIAYNNRDWPEVYQNLRNARRRWEVIARVLEKTGYMVRAWRIMYKLVEQLLLLYGTER